MIQKTENPLTQIKSLILKEKKILSEMIPVFNNYIKAQSKEEKDMFFRQLNLLKSNLKNTNNKLPQRLEKLNLAKPLSQAPETKKPVIKIKSIPISKTSSKDTKKSSHKSGHKKTAFMEKVKKQKKESKISTLEKKILERLKRKKKKVIKKKLKKPSFYVKTANKLFSNTSISLIDKMFFHTLKRDVIKAKLKYTPASYISVILFTTLLSIFIGILIFLFFLFFSIGSELPFITSVDENIGERFIKVFWILLVVPVGTFLVMYFYPSLEKRAYETKINQELPFATIHMAAISGSMIEPSKIFSIIVSTKEYPHLEKEFKKILNEINIYGHDLATALRNVAFNTPSTKLAEVLNGIATTINFGGDLPDFFEKRAQTLLFEHRLNKERHAKNAETFMDIYISIVIAAPMILMLLLMMISISGLSWLSPSMITIMMILGVSIANVVFLTFLHLKQSTE